MCIGGFGKHYIEQAVGSKWDVSDLIGETEEQATVKPVVSTWLKKRSGVKAF
jgi:hypothetical protein